MQFKDVELAGGFPKQRLPYTQKTKKWAAQCVNFGASKDLLSYSPVRKSVLHKQINYDLLNGKLYMSDLQRVINPTNIKEPNQNDIPEIIQHYPVMNSKLRILDGEEAERVFDARVVVTNPNAISDMERAKKEAIMQAIQQALMDSSESEEDFQKKMQGIADYFMYEYQDIREIRANAVLQHYDKELNFRNIFNSGYYDAKAVGEEMYQCGIISGEPFLRKLDPRQVHIYRSGYSSKIEDADMIVIEEYWSRGRIVDTFPNLSAKELDYIEGLSNSENTDNYQYRNFGGFPSDVIADATVIRTDEDGNIETVPAPGYIPSDTGMSVFSDLEPLPYDFAGNIKVCQVFWKTLRKIKKVKSYDLETGEEVYNLYPENYTINKDLGETEEILWVNEAWQGIKIGDSVYTDIGPCPVQHSSISNPSKCHFGIIGSVYNNGDNDKPYSMVDIMKPYNYMYDVIYDRLNKTLARNLGKVLRLDLAKVPSTWTMEQWFTTLKAYGVAVENSFEEGKVGMAKGKLAGAMNNASSGVIDAELGQSISMMVQTLEFLKQEMSDAVGISRQREGQVFNRETVGGIERATLQSSHITEWLFIVHEDIKKRVIECFLDYCKAAMHGTSRKFQYIMPDLTLKAIEVIGDEFEECDYGLVVDNSNQTQELASNMPMLIQAGMQNGMLTLGTVMKIYSANSTSEKQRMIERDEQMMMQRQQEAQQQAAQLKQQELQAQAEQLKAKMEHEAAMNTENNETKILVAQIEAQGRVQASAPQTEMSDEASQKLAEQKRQFDVKSKQEDRKIDILKERNTIARLTKK